MADEITGDEITVLEVNDESIPADDPVAIFDDTFTVEGTLTAVSHIEGEVRVLCVILLPNGDKKDHPSDPIVPTGEPQSWSLEVPTPNSTEMPDMQHALLSAHLLDAATGTSRCGPHGGIRVIRKE